MPDWPLLNSINEDIRRASMCNSSDQVSERIMTETMRPDHLSRDKSWNEWENALLEALVLIAARECPGDLPPLRFIYTLLTQGETAIKQQVTSAEERAAFQRLDQCPNDSARKLVVSSLSVRISDLLRR